jgi:hypothetical protein
MRFRKKPVEVDAIQWVGDNIDDVLEFVFDEASAPLPSTDGPEAGIGHTPAFGELMIPTLEGDHTASLRDWIIRGVQGELYPCKPDIFEASYERVP